MTDYTTLDSTLVASLIAAYGNKILTVCFLTKAGEIRTYTGQLRALSRLVGNERGKAQGAAMAERGQVWLARTNGKSCSFYLDRVIGLRMGGVEVGQIL